ncbi:uncharacterized protein Z519_08999 [Cladophialophora bantiana CBS 173.52]|uniref:Short-chain dehydrogenase n=1 Tax=Cladophialophora bantiana (strain ATCC 10958 / CBS 173.52 / CDC B-1940 / NIH 8579) TaxID=1442370 RepID=A0A0D2I0G2_CLAB1|nr:uncharacterized protein Z519_08999 [Cladophialophora bantiana CBS 173.52]KIW90354.1 hypothetical protein Z519_08999 [Cladophialophora bantiana CBS 173.52]
MTTATTHPDFSFATDGPTVAAAFPTAIKGRTILITGVNRKGIGYTTAEAFASQSPRCLILAGRSVSKLQECIDDLKSTYPDIPVDYRTLQVDLSSQRSVRAAGAEVVGWVDVPSIDIVINNAGIMNIPTRTITEDGVEITMATNHVGHFLLTNLIMPKILAAAAKSPRGSVRIVNLASMGINVGGVRFSDMGYQKPVTELPDEEKPNIAMMKAFNLPVDETMAYIPTAAYGASKTAAVLFSVGLNDKLYDKHGILSVAVNPGEIQTELSRYTDPAMLDTMLDAAKKHGLVWKTQQQGSSTTLVAAVDDKLSVPGDDGHGVFLSDCQFKAAPAYAVKKEFATELWEVSEGLTGEKFSW